MSKELDDFYIYMEHEYNYATTKHCGKQALLAALMEEVGELAQALLKLQYEGGKTYRDVYCEAIQVATTAMRLAVEGDRLFPAYVPNPKYSPRKYDDGEENEC